jgi:tetratricopeptide (TPR) repeat protein
MTTMPDPIGPDEGTAATRAGLDPRRTRTLEATEVDPRATVLPTDQDGAESIRSTIEDPYATRFTEASTGGFESVGSMGTWDGSGPGPGAEASRGSGPSRYRPLRLHARGGLGEIYVAVDAELNREVALKEIQERHGGHLDSQFRFVFEAEVTGGLEHPGIVPVYGLGRYPDGRPYYAMRFIRGVTFKAAIKDFHDQASGGPSPTPLRHSLAFRQLLTRFIAVCHAIDYAHGRGVLHRDIKPDNIMLGPHGETLVVDWGLAKALEREDPPEGSETRPLRPLSGSDTSATMVGSVMGTPSFMSPEQATGEVESLGPASDIFSLGSTLYALLTGSSPFHGKALTDLIEKVRRAEFPPPRGLNGAVPPALEAICLKAMARSPADRYPTAAALAVDLERWLADEPVLAYPEPWYGRLARWARRHRTAVAVSFALLLTASTALGISTVLIGREHAKSERNYRRARSAVEQMLAKVGEVDLADVPQMESVRRDLLERSLGFYREFLAERGGDLSSRLEIGRALGRLGDIREMLGEYVEAEGRYHEALSLLGGPTADVDTRRALAKTRANLGVLLKKSNRFAESETLLREALREQRALASENPKDPDDARAVSSTLYQLGTLLARLKDRSREDEAAYREAIQEQETQVARPSNSPEDRRRLARFLNNLGILQAGADPDAAEKTFLQALKIQDELQAESANNAGFRWQRARTWNNLAILYLRARLPDEAEPAFNKARAAFEALAADFPAVPDYRRELGMTLNNLGLLLQTRPPGKSNPLELFRRAEEDQRRLVAEFPEVPDHRMKLAVTRLHIGDLLRSTSPSEAETSFREAIAIQEKFVADFPQVPEYRAALGRTLTERALLLADQGHGPEAIDLLGRAVRSLELAREGNPREQSYLRFLVEAHGDRARALSKLGRHADLAIEAEQIARADPSRPDGYILAAGFLARSAELAGSDSKLADPRRRELQETYARDAVQDLRRAFDRGSKDPSILDGPDFKPLKGRPDFEKLREDWKSRGQKATV